MTELSTDETDKQTSVKVEAYLTARFRRGLTFALPLISGPQAFPKPSLKNNSLLKRSLFLIAILIFVVLQFHSCDSDDHVTPDPDAAIHEQLSETWRLQKATTDDIDVTAAFPNLTLTINDDFEFSVTNPVPPIWPASGTYSLEKNEDSGQYTVHRNDGRSVQIENITGNTLELSIQYQPGSGRTKSTGGAMEFLFVR